MVGEKGSTASTYSAILTRSPLTSPFRCSVWPSYLGSVCCENRDHFFSFSCPWHWVNSREDQRTRVGRSVATQPWSQNCLCLPGYVRPASTRPSLCALPLGEFVVLLAWWLRPGQPRESRCAVAHSQQCCLQSISFCFLTWVKCPCALKHSFLIIL